MTIRQEMRVLAPGISPLMPAAVLAVSRLADVERGMPAVTLSKHLLTSACTTTLAGRPDLRRGPAPWASLTFRARLPEPRHTRLAPSVDTGNDHDEPCPVALVRLGLPHRLRPDGRPQVAFGCRRRGRGRHGALPRRPSARGSVTQTAVLLVSAGCSARVEVTTGVRSDALRHAPWRRPGHPDAADAHCRGPHGRAGAPDGATWQEPSPCWTSTTSCWPVPR